MSVLEQAAIALLVLFGVVAVLRLVSTPLKLTLRLIANTALGFGALWLLQHTGLSLGLNLFNALTIGILGLPGLGLLVALQWILT